MQTTLHEVYVSGSEHIQPYPYQNTPLPATVPHALGQVLLHQRDWFKDLPVQFVAVDFTLPEDGYPPVDYGLEALCTAIETVLPHSLIGLLRGTEHHKELLDYHAQQAHPHIVGYALVGATLGAIPVPLAGTSLVLAIQAKLFHSIASIYGLPLTRKLYGEFTTLLSAGIGVGLLGRELIKLVPMYGWAVAGVYSGAMSYALGRAFCVYLYGFQRGALPDKASLQQAYNEAFQDARRFLHTKGNPK